MWCRGSVVALLLFQGAAFAQSVTVSVIDTARLPVVGVRVELKAGDATVTSGETDEKGIVTFTDLAPAHYKLVTIKEGLEQADRPEADVDGAATVSVTISMAAMGRHETIDVEESVTPIEQGATVPTRLPPQMARELPSRPATV